MIESKEAKVLPFKKVGKLDSLINGNTEQPEFTVPQLKPKGTTYKPTVIICEKATQTDGVIALQNEVIVPVPKPTPARGPTSAPGVRGAPRPPARGPPTAPVTAEPRARGPANPPGGAGRGAAQPPSARGGAQPP